MNWIKKSGVVISLLIVVMLCGCTTVEPPVSPLSKIPVVLLDYVDEREVFIIYLHSSSGEIRYDNMSIYMNWTNGEYEIIENDTYAIHCKTNETNFYLRVSACLKKDVYFFECNVSLEKIDDETFVTIQYFSNGSENVKKVKLDGLPWTKMLERVKKWQ